MTHSAQTLGSPSIRIRPSTGSPPSSWCSSMSLRRRGVLSFQLDELCRRARAALAGGRLRHQPRLSPAAHAPRLQDVEGVRVLPGGLRHADARGRADLLGGDAPRAPPASPITTAIRTRRATAASGRTWAGSSSATRTTTTPTLMAQVRARPRRGSVLPLAEHVSLGAAHHARLRRCSPSAAGRWCSGASSCASSFGLHAHVAGELGDAHVGHRAASRRATTRATAGGWRS